MQGSDSSFKQEVAQLGLVTDQSVFFVPTPLIGIGVGFKHWLGPGSGLEFNEPSAGLWTVYAGPRLRVEPTDTQFFLSAAWSRSLNLGVGTADEILLAVGYSFGANASADGGEPRSKSETTSQAEPAIPAAQAAPSAMMDRESPPVYVPAPGILASGDDGRLLGNSVTFLDELADSLATKFRVEWVRIEIECASARSCADARAVILRTGLERDRIVTSTSTHGARVTVVAKGRSLVGYLQTKETQWLTRWQTVARMPIDPAGRLDRRRQSEMKAVFARLGSTSHRWKNLTAFLPRSKNSGSLRADLVRWAGEKGLRKIEFASGTDDVLEIRVVANLGETIN